MDMDHQGTVTRYFPALTPAERSRLHAIDASPFPSADGAAILLGHDLWIEPLLQFRAALSKNGDAPPSLWRFAWEPSAQWDARHWLALPVDARILRARAGSPAHHIERRLTATTLQMPTVTFSTAMRTLCEAGAQRDGDAYILEPVAPEALLRVDLHLVELIVHWLRMLAHGDRVFRASIGNGFDVCGYRDACSACRSYWGERPRTAAYVPPFHPGCRCFAQPRFVA